MKIALAWCAGVCDVRGMQWLIEDDWKELNDRPARGTPEDPRLESLESLFDRSPGSKSVGRLPRTRRRVIPRKSWMLDLPAVTVDRIFSKG